MPALQPEWSDERKKAAVEGEKYNWTPVVRVEMACNNPAKPVGPLKMSVGGLIAGGTEFFCSTEVIHNNSRCTIPSMEPTLQLSLGVNALTSS